MSEGKKNKDVRPFVGRFLDMSFNRKGTDKRTERYYVLVPPEMFHEEAFPLRLNEHVVLRIDGKKVIVSRVTGDE
jgi:hypothetical protein